MSHYSATVEEIETLNRALQQKYASLGAVVAKVSDTVSRITRCPTVMTFPTLSGVTILNVKMLLIEKRQALIVVVLSGGTVRNRQTRVDEDITYEELDAISEFLNSQLAGLSASEIDEPRILLLYGAMGRYSAFLKTVLDFVLECLSQTASEVYVGGTVNILNHPEFNNIERARKFLSFIDNRENATKVLQLSTGDTGQPVKIVIGSEAGLEEMKDTSVVLADYHVGNRVRGRIGVIGPTRMNYARIVSSLEAINHRLEMILTHIYGNDE